jgi:general secretion pathway protein G
MSMPRSRWIARIIVLAVIALSFACKVEQPQKNIDASLKENLSNIRKAISNFHADKKRYPYALEELTPNYLRTMPKDPVTGGPYVVVTEEPVVESHDFDGKSAEPAPRAVVIDVRSNAPGVDAQGVRYSDY